LEKNKAEGNPEDIGFKARQIVRACKSASLGTMDRNAQTPYVSLCAFATDYEGCPVFLFSDLADHTQNIAQTPNVSLLCEQASHLSNPQAGPRVTLVGRIEKTDDTLHKELFFQQHPSAQMYAQFGDFNFYRMDVENVHYVGGFGTAQWVDGPDYTGDSAAFLNFSMLQSEALATLNEKYPQLGSICATKLLKLRGKNWQVLRVDADGMDLKLASRIVRYSFENPIKTMDELLDIAVQICR